MYEKKSQSFCRNIKRLAFFIFGLFVLLEKYLYQQQSHSYSYTSRD